jgi:hypothetical protein
MKRFILAPIGLFALVATIFAAGCAVDSTDNTNTDESDQNAHDDGVHMIGIDDNGEEQEQVNTGERPVLKHSSEAKNNGGGEGRGPLPDPWKNGPLPDPWSQPAGSSGSSGTSGSTSSSGSSGNTNGK